MGFMGRLSVKKLLLVSVIALSIGGGAAYYFTQERGPIYHFNEQRDTAELVELMKKNAYWLSDNPNFNPEFHLKYRTPDTRPSSAGTLSIRVLRQEDKLVGFIAYHMRSAALGFVLFIAIKPEFRGKRYGQQLMRYAVDDLTRKGAVKIRLVTRPANKPGHALYKRFGFKLMREDDTFSYFEYDI